MLRFYNTLTRKKEQFEPLEAGHIRLYTCGPTVYNFAHLGNLRTYVFEDVLRRTLEYLGFTVKHVMNITDVGHLVSDADTGEDKMQQALEREGLKPTVESLTQLAERYTRSFLRDLDDLNIQRPHAMPKATDHIPQMITMIKVMVEKGYAYETPLAVYFDVAKFPAYTELSRQTLQEKVTGARDEVAVDSAKRHPADFALWFKLVGRYKTHVMRWPSPWGDGFPGWHIECSAMSLQHLGFPFDLHCGGVDHIGVHHSNEIAQNFAFFGQPAVKMWLHGEFLDVQGEKMAKSAGGILTLQAVREQGIDPLAFRYLCLGTHYRQKLNFSWEALRAAAQALEKLRNVVREFAAPEIGCAGYEDEYAAAINDDLNVPKALGVLWEMLDDQTLPGSARRQSVEKFDQALGLGIAGITPVAVPAAVGELVKQREAARQVKNWRQADQLRRQIEQEEFAVEDTPGGPKVKPRRQPKKF